MKYNGHLNYETWNVSLWIGNDEGLYAVAKHARSYKRFIEAIREFEGPIGVETPDHVAWNDSSLDIDSLDEMICEL